MSLYRTTLSSPILTKSNTHRIWLIPSLIRSSKSTLCSQCANRNLIAVFQRQQQATYATHKEQPENEAGASSAPGKGPSGASIFFQKLKNGSSFAFTTALVVGSIGVTGLAIYAIGKELFSSSGDTKLFNRSINLIENNLYCQKLLCCQHGDEKLAAYGEDYTRGNRNGWGNRNRPIASARRIDKNTGDEHLFMKYHIESAAKRGIVQLEAIKDAKTHKTEIRSLLLAVDNEQFYVVAPPRKSRTLPISGGQKGSGFLGIKWGTK